MKRRCQSRAFTPKKRARIEKLLKSEATTITCTSESATELTTDPAPDWSFMAPEVLLRIFSKLDYDSLRHCATACRFWLQCANDESLAVVLIDTFSLTPNTDNEAKWKKGRPVRTNYKSLNSDGDYETKTLYLRHKKVPDYINQDYIELREDAADILGVYLRTARLPKKFGGDTSKALNARLDVSLLELTSRVIIKTYKENFDPTDLRSLSISFEPYLALDADQQQSVLWMIDREANETTFKIRPLVPLTHTPLALHIPSERLRMKKDIPEVAVSASNGLIVADTFHNAAMRVIGLIYATRSNSHRKTLIVVKDMARAARWAEYLLKVRKLYFSINPPPYIPYFNDPRVTVWIYTSKAFINTWGAKSPPLARTIFDEGCARARRCRGFEWYLKIIDESGNQMKPSDLSGPIMLDSGDSGVAYKIQLSHEPAEKYFRDWKLVPQLVQHCVWICRGTELQIKNEREYLQGVDIKF